MKKDTSSDKMGKQSDHPSIRTFLAVDLIRRTSVQFVLTHNPSLYKKEIKQTIGVYQASLITVCFQYFYQYRLCYSNQLVCMNSRPVFRHMQLQTDDLSDG